MKRAVCILAICVFFIPATVCAQSNFEDVARTVFHSSITKKVLFKEHTGGVSFLPKPDYFGTGDKINKVMAIESARLFWKVPELERLALAIPHQGTRYFLDIRREEIQKFYSIDFKKIHGDLDAWRANFIQKYDDKSSRARFVDRFVKEIRKKD